MLTQSYKQVRKVNNHWDVMKKKIMFAELLAARTPPREAAVIRAHIVFPPYRGNVVQLKWTKRKALHRRNGTHHCATLHPRCWPLWRKWKIEMKLHQLFPPRRSKRGSSNHTKLFPTPPQIIKKSNSCELRRFIEGWTVGRVVPSI